MPGVDGLRAVAVLAVLVYHLGADWLPGGFLGVDVFFVISGFLITSLLVGEHRSTGRIRLGRFWRRRAWRLLPALLLMLLVTLAVMLVAHPDEVGRLRVQVVAAMGYVINWHFIYADVPYFEQFGRPSVFLHLWSLAIEEQFYLLWPPILAVALARSWRGLLPAVVAGAVASTVAAWTMWRPFEDPSRIYYGTDTRAVALLAGVALALVIARGGARRHGRAWDTVGVLSLAGVLGAMLVLGDLDERLYRGGFLLVAVASAGTILSATNARSPVGRLLGRPIMVWLGLRSYGIYLWHWPVIMLTRPDVDVPLDGVPLVVLRTALTLAAAALSYRYVETPLRRHGFGAVRGVLSAVRARFGRTGQVATASTAALGLAGIIALVAFSPARPLTDQALATPAQSSVPVSAGRAPADGRQLLFVGDSVMLSASPALKDTFGARAVIDAAVGRRFPEGAEIVMARLARSHRDIVVIIHLGNNYFIAPAELDALMTRLPTTQQVVFLTVRVPLAWQDSVNEILRSAPRRYPNASVVDWFAVSGEPGLLVDGAHTNQRGMRRYADAIATALTDRPQDISHP